MFRNSASRKPARTRRGISYGPDTISGRCAQGFNGWISGSHTLNPYQSDAQLKEEDHTGVNHILVLNLEPELNQQNFSDINLSN